MRIEVDGQHFEVPDDATPDEIDSLTKPAAPAMQREPTIGERLKYAAHKTAGLLPMAGAIAGGTLGGGLGGAVGFPTTGPGGIAATAAGAGLGAGLGSSGGKSLQHFVDTALGYENNPGIAATAKDSAVTGAKDAALTTAAGIAVPTLFAAAGRAAPALDSLGNKLGRRVLNGGATPLTVKKPLSDAAVDAAYDAGAFKPWGTTQRAANVVDAARETAGSDYARVVAELKAKGVNGPDIPDLAQEYLARAGTAQANTLNPSVPAVYETAAAQLQKQATPPYAPGQGSLALDQAENMKRSLQGLAKSAYQQQLPNEVGEAHMNAASMLKAAVEKAIGKQSALAPDEAAAFVPVKQQLGPLIEAGNAATRGAAMADRRSAFSLTDYLAAAAGAAHSHSPLETGGLMLANKALRTYGPSAAAWASKGGADLLERLASIPAAQTARVGATAAAGASESPQPSPGDLLRQLLLLSQVRSSPAPQ